VHKLKALDISRDSTSNNESKEPKESMDSTFDHEAKLLCFTMEISSDLGVPKMLKEALARRDADKWREAIANKIMNFLKQDAWKKVPMSQVHRERRVAIPTKPVYKIKDKQDGSKWYKAHIVTKGFLMIPGVDYTESESFLPVTMETGVQCVIGISLHFINEDIVLNVSAERRWILEVYDIEAAFLNANLGGCMYIKILDEMVELKFVTKQEGSFLQFC